MTPKTQSVCKHCGENELNWRHDIHIDAITVDPYHPFEPVAEPSSTGEPRGITDMYKEGDENPNNVRFTYPARPSGPSDCHDNKGRLLGGTGTSRTLGRVPDVPQVENQ